MQNGARPNRAAHVLPPTVSTDHRRAWPVNGASSEAGRRLAQQFEQHHIRKRYHAIVRAG